MFEAWRRRRALKRIVARLPLDLARRYGSSDRYTAGQVRATWEAGQYGERYSGYAFALCLSPDDAAAVLGDDKLVQDLRTELAKAFFGGDLGFSARVRRRGEIGNPATTSMSIQDQAIGADNSGVPGSRS